MDKFSIKRLKEFVALAKSNSFAGAKTKSNMDNGGSMYSYKEYSEKGELIYSDIYFGNLVEGGTECVTLDGHEIWKCQYYGGISIDTTIPKSIINNTVQKLLDQPLPIISDTIEVFLRQALLSPPISFPVRGPQEYTTNNVVFNNQHYAGNWVYKNNWTALPLFGVKDPFYAFYGKEIITFCSVELFWHCYQGGLVYDKNSPLVIEIN